MTPGLMRYLLRESDGASSELERLKNIQSVDSVNLAFSFFGSKEQRL